MVGVEERRWGRAGLHINLLLQQNTDKKQDQRIIINIIIIILVNRIVMIRIK